VVFMDGAEIDDPFGSLLFSGDFFGVLNFEPVARFAALVNQCPGECLALAIVYYPWDIFSFRNNYSDPKIWDVTISGGETKCDGRTNMFRVLVNPSRNPLYSNDATVLSVSGSGTVETWSVNPRATPNVTLLNKGDLVKKPNVFPMAPIVPEANKAYMQYTAI